ncbi:BrnT family toxin [Methylobacterium sp. Gmos1]
MLFEWDDEKSQATLAARGFDFAHAARVFEGLTVQTHDQRRAYGEMRVSAVGEVDGDMFQVVFTDRPSGRRIISARKASRRERREWHALVLKTFARLPPA